MTSLNLQTLKNEIDRLSLPEKLDLMAYIAEKVPIDSLISAEKKAIERLNDLDKSEQWITTLDQEDEINEESLNHWLQKRGYQTQISD
ncbi:hypothetical protein [Crocosphaera sp. XPORK-15E]|uniref:hypothetical protein n=1 Tax=Crocosphaera sp. XPORK-15E TaxID=3110247 RepID=UPI002B213CFD|nr:hypothetical protein [Crocosphaera sp. XPORK-15E]MEA5536023.1 hypothetical protein [Crocosphaera sp. XPORK-15E]